MCSLENVFSQESVASEQSVTRRGPVCVGREWSALQCVLYRRCSLENVFSKESVCGQGVECTSFAFVPPGVCWLKALNKQVGLGFRV